MRSTAVVNPAARVGLSGVAAVLGARPVSLAELAAAGRLVSPVERLTGGGFTRAFIAEPEGDGFSAALRAAREALAEAELKPEDVDVLIWAGALPQSHLHGDTAGFAEARDRPTLLKSFRYAGSAMQRELGLCRAQVTGAAQQGCASMFAALRNARALLTAEPSLRHVLCAGADVLPPGAPREILYNVISDAACAVVVSRSATRDRWIGFSQVSNGWCGDPIEHEAEIVAAYFPTARALVRELLAEHGLRPEDVDAVVPTGVHRAAWEILLRLVGIPVERLCRPAESFGHSIAADNFVILQELRRTGALEAGARVLLFTYGFGSTWSALLLEH